MIKNYVSYLPPEAEAEHHANTSPQQHVLLPATHGLNVQLTHQRAVDEGPLVCLVNNASLTVSWKYKLLFEEISG